MSKVDDDDDDARAHGDVLTRRDALVVIGGAGLAAVVGCSEADDDRTSSVASAVANPSVPVIQGYPWPPSVIQGATLALHVSTTAANFLVDFYREGPVPPQFMGRSPVLAGVSVPRGTYDMDWAWPSYGMTIPPSWPSGAYLAVLRRADAAGTPLDPLPGLATANGETKVLFVVRSVAPGTASSVLYKVPLFTYHAYNATAGSSLYVDGNGTQRVTLRRAGGGTGHGEPLFLPCEPDPLGSEGDVQWNTFEKWDAKFIRWLEREQVAVEYCTDWDLDQVSALLSSYHLVLSVGHDEYWSPAMRDHLESFIAGGGNVAFFSGNTCFWRVDVVDGDAIFCDKGGPEGNYHWYLQPLPNGDVRTENSLTGVGFYSAGGKWNNGETCMVGPREAIGYTVHNTDFWVFQGTGDILGSQFGAAASLVGYEADGAPLDRNANLLYTRRTPQSFHVLGHAFLPATWSRSVPSIDEPQTTSPPDIAAATMGIYNHNGTVFNAATTDWARVLAGGDAVVQQITRNVLDRLKRRVCGRDVLATVSAVRGVGCYAGSDGFDHAVVAVSSGDIHEFYWQSGLGVGHGILTTLPGAVSVAGFQGGDDYQHAIVAASDGGVHEVYWRSGEGAHHGQIGQIAGALAVAGFASPDGLQHAIVVAVNGDVHELYWGSGVALQQEILANIAMPKAVAAYFAAVDGRNHVVVSDLGGRVHELYWVPGDAVNHRVIAMFDRGTVAIGGHYAAADGQQHVVVAAGDGNTYELTWRSTDGIVRDVLPSMATAWRTSSVVAMASYVSGDGYQHAIAADTGAVLHELYWKS